MQAGLENCQRCGMPLYSMHQKEMEPHKDIHGQTELPTWLESLRVDERSNPPVSDQSHFSMSDLINEGALPSWMRQENAEMIEKGNSGMFPAWRPASMTAPQTDEANLPPEGFPARLLIDEESLPSWLQSTTGPLPVTPESQKNFSAANLIQPDDLPDWLKSVQQSSQSFVPQNNAWGDAQPPATQIHPNSITPNPAYNSSPLPPQSFQDESSGLHASSLFDTNSLPPWLREGDQRQAYGSSQSGQAPTANSGLTGSSLIDENAIPGWLRSFDHQQQTNVQSMGNMLSHPSGAAPRIENARVPSRPRGEIAPQEQSEVAANVFSSVLGVSSSAPYFPATQAGSQWQTPAQGATFPSQGLQNVQPQPPAGMQWNAPVQPPGTTGGPQAQAYNPAGGNVGSTGRSQHPQQLPNTNGPNSKLVKRFLETIRSWFK
jgi:hypothetical protein